jgi:SHAQKYF class myb-like DNA-binding protein
MVPPGTFSLSSENDPFSILFWSFFFIAQLRSFRRISVGTVGCAGFFGKIPSKIQGRPASGVFPVADDMRYNRDFGARRLPEKRSLSAVESPTVHSFGASGFPGSANSERPKSQRRMALEAAREQALSAAAMAASQDEEAREESEVEESPEDGGQEKKTRFVWTRDLHSRFERAVQQLGVHQAKPQGIRQLMGCETESEPPTRQNIKSHLQKYRLHLQKQAAQQAASEPESDGRVSNPSDVSTRPQGARDRGGSSGGAPQGASRQGSLSSSGTAPAAPPQRSATDRLSEQQQAGLIMQLELHSKLHEVLLQQRQTQAAMGWRLASSDSEAVLGRDQLRRMAEQVLVQRQLLMHLCQMLQASHADLRRSLPFAGRMAEHGELAEASPYARALDNATMPYAANKPFGLGDLSGSGLSNSGGLGSALGSGSIFDGAYAEEYADEGTGEAEAQEMCYFDEGRGYSPNSSGDGATAFDLAHDATHLDAIGATPSTAFALTPGLEDAL